MDDLIKDFLVESNENLDRLDLELVKLESDPSSKVLLSSIFRTIHTVKGACGFLGFTKLEKVAHAGENLLSRLRDGEIALNKEITTALLQMVDAVRSMLSCIQTTEHDGDEYYADLIERLRQLQILPEESGTSQQPTQASEKSASILAAPQTGDGPAGQPAANMASQNSLAAPESDASKPAASAETAATEAPAQAAPAETIRVDVHLLDKVMNLVGELVLTRNQITQFAGRQEDLGFLNAAQQLNLLTSELQEEITKTRMQPISNIFEKFPRVVRDVAAGAGKEVQIEMEGKETELDKSLLEAIKDPLTHIVRNSVDHGIEKPEDRIAKGKRREGRLILRARHEGGQVLIEITDDGAGINIARVKEKALERGVVTSQQAGRMSEREVLNLIFLPGFSTAEKVTNLSGRGVGMDVVRTNIEKVNGSVDIQSAAGQGTTIKIKIPLTLAIVPVLIVRSLGKRFAIPQVSLVELVRLEPEQMSSGIEMVHGVPVYRLRGRLLPLAYLSRELLLTSVAGNSAVGDEAVNIVVLQADDRQFGLVVDEIHDTEEIVVKPLSRHLKGIPTYAGATIMGDGKVALILDVIGFAKRAGIISEVRDHALDEIEKRAEEESSEKQTFIVFAGPDGARMALPLHALARLEEVPASQVEKSGDAWVAQYRGQILTLIRLSLVLEERRRYPRHEDAPSVHTSDPLQVLVINHEQRTFGLVVENILDIIEDRADVTSPPTRGGVQFAALIGGRVTELLDIPSVLEAEAYFHGVRHEQEEVSR